MSTPKELRHLLIPLEEIVKATNNFSEENIIGRGGFGKVYKGNLFWQGQSIKIVAKRLDGILGHGANEFWMDISIRFSLSHKNLLSIVGFCDENDEKVIINKHEANGSLDKYLSDPTLTWIQRLRISVGVAHALSYIYYDVGRDFSVIHRNIKSSKILLDDNWEPKISSFALSMKNTATRRNRLHLSSVCGTFGYADPTYIKTGSVTHKSDLYSFGVVLFEVLCGVKAFTPGADDNGRFLAQLVRSHYEKENLDDIINPDLRKQMDPQSLKIFSETAYYCLSVRRAERPNIDQIIARLQKALEEHIIFSSEVEGTSLDHRKLQWKSLEHLRIGLDDIKLATENFADKYHIGLGAFGIVYKTELEHFDNINSKAIEGENKCELPKRRSVVAIKRILYREDKQGEQGFIAEIETLSSCKHRNIVSLLGFCDESPEMILVYEHAFNGSLDNHLRSIDHMTNFTWEKRLQLGLDIAEGLNYLHTKDVQRIIHRDIKSDNILLDQNWVGKIADFGLSKFGLTYQQASYLETNIAGTNVYMDPEYEKTHKLKIESDIYSFGVVLFEILSGKLAYDPFYMEENPKGLAPIARQHFIKGTLKEMVDPKLKEEVDENIFTLSKGPDQDSLDTFSKVAYQCLAETQAQRPTMKIVIEELEKALYFQDNSKDSLKISLQDIEIATQYFNPNNLIGRGGFGKAYKGEVVHADGQTTIVAKRLDREFGQGEHEFFIELEVLFEYKHENIIDLIGYCNEEDEKIIVYQYAPKGSLDKHLKDVGLTWTKRLKIGIDIANGLDFLHGGVVTQDVVIHRDISSSNILLYDDWNAKISDFGLSVITPINKEIGFVIESAAGRFGYIDPVYQNTGFLTRESDIYSFGIVLFELLCGRKALPLDVKNSTNYLHRMVMRHYEEGNLDELVFEGIREQIVPQSLITFQRIAYQCIQTDREKRPTAKEVSVQLKNALEFHEDYEIWEPKLPRGYKEIIKLSKTPDMFYSTEKKKDLYDMFSKGFLLQEGKVWFSLSNNGENNEMISSRMFYYGNRSIHKWRSIQKSRFPIVAKMLNISNQKIQIKIKPQFLSPDVIYGAHLVFKFCDPRKFSSQPMYVNLKYKLERKTLRAYFARWREDEWMMIELWQFLSCKYDTEFEVMLESFSRYYCGSGAIYIEGIEFRAIDNVKPEVYEKPKEVQQKLSIDYNEMTKLNEGRKMFSLNKVKGTISLMLPAKMVLYDSRNVKCINWKYLPGSRFGDVAVLLSHQVFRIKCKIETQKLSSNADYACYLVFKLLEKCKGLQCPVKVRDVLLRKNKETKFIYLKYPSSVNLHDLIRVPKLREDGLMEVLVWEFKSSNKLNDDIPMHLKLRCYEGTMCGLVVYGIEFRPV